MILAAGLLVLLGLGLFVAGVLTGVTWLYWACVAACVAAAGLLFLARRQIAATARGGAPATPIDAPATPMDATATATAPGAGSGAVAPTEPVAGPEDLPDPPVEDVEVTDLLLVVDLKDEVLVVDEHPRYHLAGCGYLSGRTTIPLPIDEARGDGFTPCATCEPDRNLADRARARRRKAARGS